MRIDYNLPAVTLPETADLSALEAKYQEELSEWRREEKGSFAELIEAWDVVTVCNTWMCHKDSGSHAIEAYFSARKVIERYARDGRDVMAAKAATILKNAKRGYYDWETCQIAIYEKGHQWQP